MIPLESFARNAKPCCKGVQFLKVVVTDEVAPFLVTKPPVRWVNQNHVVINRNRNQNRTHRLAARVLAPSHLTRLMRQQKRIPTNVV